MKTERKIFIKKSEKVMGKKDINMEEFGHLSKFDTLHNNELKDYMYLSKLSAHLLIDEFLEKEIKIICNLTDREGKIGEEIVSVSNDIESDFSIVKLKNGKFTKLEDKFLYNINFITKKNYYSLTIQDEYFEKIIIDK